MDLRHSSDGFIRYGVTYFVFNFFYNYAINNIFYFINAIYVIYIYILKLFVLKYILSVSNVTN